MYEDEESKINTKAIIIVLVAVAVVEFFIMTIHAKHEPKPAETTQPVDPNQPFVSVIVPLDENGQELAPYSDKPQVDQEIKN